MFNNHCVLFKSEVITGDKNLRNTFYVLYKGL